MPISDSQASYDGLEEAALARLTRAPRVRILRTVPSVMDVAHGLGEAGAPSGSFVIADEQTAGRGRAGRAWFSPPGAGIWIAMLLRPAAPPPGGSLGIRVALAVHDALAATAPRVAPLFKWPNDLLVDGRKLGGILCEARWTGEALGWITAGIGLNVHGPVPPPVRDLAIAIVDLDADVSRLGILEAMVPRVAATASHAGALTAAERAAYLDRLAMPEGTDTPVGLEPDGALLVRTHEGRVERRSDAS